MADDDSLVGSDEASAILGIHRATLLRWAADPANPLIPIHRLPGPNGAMLFSRAQVRRIASQRAARKAS
jgi:hypothetical protein